MSWNEQRSKERVQSNDFHDFEVDVQDLRRTMDFHNLGRKDVRRAEAVKAYLVSKGIEKNRVYTEGKGEKQPVADNKTAEGRAKNRRVEIEVVGTRAAK